MQSLCLNNNERKKAMNGHLALAADSVRAPAIVFTLGIQYNDSWIDSFSRPVLRCDPDSVPGFGTSFQQCLNMKEAIDAEGELAGQRGRRH